MKQTKSRPTELDRADEMLRTFKRIPPGTYKITPSQLPLIKLFWDELHSFTGGTYSISEDGSEIIKYE